MVSFVQLVEKVNMNVHIRNKMLAISPPFAVVNGIFHSPSLLETSLSLLGNL